ncbi:MAG: tRNA (guanine(26)-N(2))-dimethyltransferase [Thermosphaera sp.]
MIFQESEEVISEGLARVIVPRLKYYIRSDGRFEPAWMPVFYNPEAVLGRDVTVLYLSTRFKNGSTFIDALAGTGVRGIRISLEANGEGIVNDVDPRAYYYIKRNIAINNLQQRVQAFNQEANALLNMLTFTGIPFDYVDVDPYGSPVPYLDSAFKPLAKKASLGISATDTAPLTCSNRAKMLRRYWHKCVDVDFNKELGIRVLISNVALRGAAHDVAVKPVVSFQYRHYYRVIFETERGASPSLATLNKCIGYIWYSPKTLERGFIDNEVGTMELEKEGVVLVGPLWKCNIFSTEVINDMIINSTKYPWLQRQTIKLLKSLNDESRVENPYVRLDKIYSRVKKNMPPIERVIEALQDHGFRVSRTHFDPRGIRIDGDFLEAVKILESL